MSGFICLKVRLQHMNWTAVFILGVVHSARTRWALTVLVLLQPIKLWPGEAKNLKLIRIFYKETDDQLTFGSAVMKLAFIFGLQHRTCYTAQIICQLIRQAFLHVILYELEPDVIYFPKFCHHIKFLENSQPWPSVLWCCWLCGRKGIRLVKNWVVGCWHGYPDWFYLSGTGSPV